MSLERLAMLSCHKLQRIGLSATQKPLEMVARFLVGAKRKSPVIINISHVKNMHLQIEVPNLDLGAVPTHEMWDEIYQRIGELSKTHRTILVFANTRRLVERIAHHLGEQLGFDEVTAHHGSLSRKLRLDAENKLKNGELKILVSTASLELGIDIGEVDLICQIGSPRSIAIALQRIGRSGHWHRATSKGHFFATTRGELLECAALLYSIKQGDLDPFIMPEEPLDILMQQIIAICASEDIHEDNLFKIIKKAYPYAALTKEKFDSILLMQSEGIAGSRGRYGNYLYRDGINKIVKGRRGSRITAIRNGGAIPDNTLFTVIDETNGVMAGTLDEDFAIESNRGDIFLLGTTSWKVVRVESGAAKIIVENAQGAPPNVPFWRGEAPNRTNELSDYVSLLREKLNNFTGKDSDITWLNINCGCNEKASRQLIKYIEEGKQVLGTIPPKKMIIAERFFDEAGGMQLVLHSPFGAKINKAWGLALRKRFCRSFNFELQAAATDDGLIISLTEQHSFPLSDVFKFLHPNTVKEVLIQAVLQSPIFKTRWRWVAMCSLALAKYRGSKKIPPHILRILTDDLLAAVFPQAAACQDNLAGHDIEMPNHILIKQAMNDVLGEALDVQGLISLLENLENGFIQCKAIDTQMPSVFSHEILNANPYAFLDDAPLEERRARAVELRQILPESFKEIGILDKKVIEIVTQHAWPDIRNPDDLHETLQSLIYIMEVPTLQDAMLVLIKENRATTAIIKNKKVWVAMEKAKIFLTLHPQALFTEKLIDIESVTVTYEEALLDLIRNWMHHLGPTTAEALSIKLSVDVSNIEQTLIQLENSGFILRGQFNDPQGPTEWCERRLLAKIHRLTVLALRKEIEPIKAEQFANWLMKWQYLGSNNQIKGEQGLLEVIKKLQGFELPANAWESQIFAKRVVDYEPAMLDRLCLSGTIKWGRLSTPPKINKRILPKSTSPITFYLRNETPWLPLIHNEPEITTRRLSELAKVIFEYLQCNGASFFSDIVDGLEKLKSHIELALWELVAAGLVTADGFDNLRSLLDKRRRLNKKYRHQYLSTSGRWSLLKLPKQKEEYQMLESLCSQLLLRYGVVFRDILAREKNILPWRILLPVFRRLEDKGQIRSGQFVHGFPGEQFALPYAVESLRANKNNSVTESLSVSAIDPLNLGGIILKNRAISRKFSCCTRQN